VQITEFPIGGNPIPLVVGPDGNLWTWLSGTPTVARMTPSGVVSTYDTAGYGFPASTPGHCVDAHDGNVWCSNTGGAILRVSASNGVGTVFALPTDAGATDLTLGPDGNLWFTDFGLNKIGRMTLAGTVTEFSVPAEFIAPRSITVGADGALWFTSDTAQVGRMDTSGGGFRYYNLPEFPDNTVAAMSAIRTGSDGNLWLGITPIMGSPKIYRVSLSGQITGFTLPNPADGVIDIVSGPDGAIWFTQESANQIGRITTSGNITEYDLQPNSGPVGITVGRDGAIWFTELAGRIGRLSGGPLAATAIPTLSPLALLAMAALLTVVAVGALRR
ncbi:MAG: virginiamycin B lyase family protein, partial [Thermomicrobiales bacterium]